MLEAASRRDAFVFSASFLGNAHDIIDGSGRCLYMHEGLVPPLRGTVGRVFRRKMERGSRDVL